MMRDVNGAEKAGEVYHAMCAAIEKKGWNCSKAAPLKLVHLSFQSDDLPISLLAQIDEERMIIRLTSILPFKMIPEKRLEGATVACVANDKLIDGCFLFYMRSGAIVFRMNCSYRDGVFSEDQFQYLIGFVVSAVEEYLRAFYLINENRMSLADFLAQE